MCIAGELSSMLGPVGLSRSRDVRGPDAARCALNYPPRSMQSRPAHGAGSRPVLVRAGSGAFPGGFEDASTRLHEGRTDVRTDGARTRFACALRVESKASQRGTNLRGHSQGGKTNLKTVQRRVQRAEQDLQLAGPGASMAGRRRDSWYVLEIKRG